MVEGGNVVTLHYRYRLENSTRDHMDKHYHWCGTMALFGLLTAPNGDLRLFSL